MAHFEDVIAGVCSMTGLLSLPLIQTDEQEEQRKVIIAVRIATMRSRKRGEIVFIMLNVKI